MSIKKRYKGQIVEVLKKGKKNTRVKYPDNSTGLVPNEELETIADVSVTQSLEAEVPLASAELPDTNTAGGSAPEITEPTPSPESEETDLPVVDIVDETPPDLGADRRKALAETAMKEEEDRKVLEDIAGPSTQELPPTSGIGVLGAEGFGLMDRAMEQIKEIEDKKALDTIKKLAAESPTEAQAEAEKSSETVTPEDETSVNTDNLSEAEPGAVKAMTETVIPPVPKKPNPRSVPRSRAHLMHEVVNPDPPSPKGALPSHAKRRE